MSEMSSFEPEVCGPALRVRMTCVQPAIAQNHLSGKSGGFNGSTQHQARTPLTFKTNVKIACQGSASRNVALVRLWQATAKRVVLRRNDCRIKALDGVASTG